MLDETVESPQFQLLKQTPVNSQNVNKTMELLKYMPYLTVFQQFTFVYMIYLYALPIITSIDPQEGLSSSVSVLKSHYQKLFCIMVFVLRQLGFCAIIFLFFFHFIYLYFLLVLFHLIPFSLFFSKMERQTVGDRATVVGGGHCSWILLGSGEGIERSPLELGFYPCTFQSV